MSVDSQHSSSTEEELRAAVEDARRLATAKPTQKNRKALKSAQADLDAFLQEQLEPVVDQVFSSIPEVVDYLRGEGWKISKSTAYEHWRSEGKIHAREDGSFELSEVERYARTHLIMQDGSTPGEDLAAEKRREETLRIRTDRQMRELRLRQAAGELIPRSLVEVELSDRATVLRLYLDSIARSSAGRIIKLVDGDPEKSKELISYLLKMFRRAMDNYSKPMDFDEEEK